MKHVDQARYAGHTPGPWVSNQTGECEQHHARTAWTKEVPDPNVNDTLICFVSVEHWEENQPDWRTKNANAKLIADSPQLLADLIECEKQRDALHRYLSWAVDLIDMYDEFLIKLGEPKEKVYSEVHLKRKADARAALALCNPET